MKRELTLWGTIMYKTKAIRPKDHKIRVIHPLGFITILFMIAIAPFIAMVTDDSLQWIAEDCWEICCFF